MTTTKKVAVLAVLLAAAVLAAFGGGWKWDGHGGNRIAGWAWGDDGATLIDGSTPGTTPVLPEQAAPQAQAALENSG